MTTELTKTAAGMVAEAKRRVENLTPEQVVAELQEREPLLVDHRRRNAG